MDSFVASKKRVPSKLNTPLAHSFGFDYGDLQDNRTGFISHWQKKRLRWYLLSYSVSIMIWIAILNFIPFALILDARRLMIVPTLWLAIVLVIFGTFWLWQVRAVYLDMRHGKVAELIAEVRHVREIRAQRRQVGTDTYVHEMDYFVTIGRERFSTTQHQMESFKQGALYHIYLAPESRQILSATLLTNDEMDDLETAFLSQKSKLDEAIAQIDTDGFKIKSLKEKR